MVDEICDGLFRAVELLGIGAFTGFAYVVGRLIAESRPASSAVLRAAICAVLVGFVFSASDTEGPYKTFTTMTLWAGVPMLVAVAHTVQKKT